MGTVLIIGGSNTDMVCRAPRIPAPGETIVGRAFDTFAGGKGANQAVAAARAGAQVSFLGAFGDDSLGEQRRADLALESVDVSHVLVVPGVASGVALIVVDDAGENQIVVVPGANDNVTVDAARSALQSIAPNVIGIALEIPYEVVKAAVQSRPTGTAVVVNAAPFDPRITDLLPLIDVIVCNEVEASGILGRSVEIDSAILAAENIRARGCRTVVVTLGRNGAAVCDAAGSWLEPAPTVDVVDTTGAGDAFCGALVAWLSEGAPLREAVAAAVSAGSLATTVRGAQPSLPRRQAIVRAMADQENTTR